MGSQYRRAIRDKLCDAQDWLCHWCKGVMRPVEPGQVILDEDHATIDHLVALQDDGDPLDRSNMVAACRKCNHERHHPAGSLKPKEKISCLQKP